jgi:hypothetical protein
MLKRNEPASALTADWFDQYFDSTTKSPMPPVRPSSRPTHLSILCEVDLEHAFVVVKPQCTHRSEDVLAVDRLALLIQAFLRSFGGLIASARFGTGWGLVTTRRGYP